MYECLLYGTFKKAKKLTDTSISFEGDVFPNFWVTFKARLPYVRAR